MATKTCVFLPNLIIITNQSTLCNLCNWQRNKHACRQCFCSG